MPEERHVLHTRQGSSHGSNIGSDQSAPQVTTGARHRPRDSETRNPEMLARALLRARECIQNKENIVPEKPGSRRRRRRRVSTSRSPLPADYPRAPLQDITRYMHMAARILSPLLMPRGLSSLISVCHNDGRPPEPLNNSDNNVNGKAIRLHQSQILQRSRTRARARARMQIHGMSPPRQPMIPVSPARETPAEEHPLLETEAIITNSTLILEGPLQERETAMENPILALDGPLQERETAMENPIVGLEGPLQNTETTMTNPRLVQEGPFLETDSTIINSILLPEQETRGPVIDHETEEQNRGPEWALNHPRNVITDNSLTAEAGLGFHHDNQIQEIGSRNGSILASREDGRAFGTVLQSCPRNEKNERDRGGSRAQPKKTSSLKPLMRMR